MCLDLNSSNNAINSDSEKRRTFVAPLFIAGYGERWAAAQNAAPTVRERSSQTACGSCWRSAPPAFGPEPPARGVLSTVHQASSLGVWRSGGIATRRHTSRQARPFRAVPRKPHHMPEAAQQVAHARTRRQHRQSSILLAGVPHSSGVRRHWHELRSEIPRSHR